MSVIHHTGDIFTSDVGVIGHGVNMKGVMGSGIAKTVRERFPSVDRDYRRAIASGALTPGSVLLSSVLERPGLRIANISSQVKTGRNADLRLLESGLVALMTELAAENTFTFAIPRIGAGIGGLDWDTEVLPLVERLDRDYNKTFDIEAWTFEP